MDEALLTQLDEVVAAGPVGLDAAELLAPHLQALYVLSQPGAAFLQARNAIDRLADTLGDRGRVRITTDLCRLGLDADSRILGPDHPDTLTSRNNLANAYRAAGRPPPDRS